MKYSQTARNIRTFIFNADIPEAWQAPSKLSLTAECYVQLQSGIPTLSFRLLKALQLVPINSANCRVLPTPPSEVTADTRITGSIQLLTTLLIVSCSQEHFFPFSYATPTPAQTARRFHPTHLKKYTRTPLEHWLLKIRTTNTSSSLQTAGNPNQKTWHTYFRQ